MSIPGISRSLHALRFSLESCPISVEAPSGMVRPSRYRELDTLYLLHDVMEQCPELVEISLESDIRKSYFGSQGDEDVVTVGASLTFAIEAGGREYRFHRRPDRSADPEIRKIIDEVCGHFSESAEYARLERLKDGFNEVLRYFDENRGEMHNLEFWRQRAKLLVPREIYTSSFVAGVFDPDIFRATLLDKECSIVTSPQRDLTGAPYFWNRATIKTLAARLEAGMDPGACDANGVSPLVAACVYGDLPAMALLLEAGADPDRVDGTGQNPVSVSIAAGYHSCFTYLVEKGANPNGPSMSPTVLAAIAIKDGAKLFPTLLEAGVDLGARMPDGKPFYPGTERFLGGSEPAQLRKRQAFAEIINSTAIERAISVAIEPSGVNARQPRSTGMSL